MANNRQIEWILFIAIILFFYPYLSLGFTTNDDAFNQVYHSWVEFKEGAFKQGRIQFFLFHWLVIKLSFLVESLFFIKLIATLSIIINILYLAFFIEKITVQKYYSYIFIIVFITFLQDSWDHFLLTSSPLIYTVGFSLFLASLHLYIFSTATPKKLMISAGLFVLTLQVSEMFVLFFVFYPLFSRLYLNKGLFYNLKYHIISSAIYLSIYIAFRLIYGSVYVGNSVGSGGFSILDSIQTLLIYSLYTFPSALFFTHTATGLGDMNNVLNYPFDFNLASNPLSKFKYNVKVLTLNVEELNVIWIIKYLLFIGVVFESLKHINIINRKNLNLLILFAILLLFVPNSLHSLVSKYQQWAIVGNSKGYVGTYMSYFGMGLLLTLFIVYLKELGWFTRPSFLSRAGLGLVILFLFFISTFVSISNEAIFNLKKQSHYRWELMDKFFTTNVFKNLDEGTNIYAIGLTDSIGAVDKYQPLADERSDYWDRYVLMKTGKHIKIYEGYPKTVTDKNYILKIIKPKNNYDTFGIFAKLDNDSKLINNFYLIAEARDTNILTYESLNEFKSFPFRLKGEEDIMLVEEKGVSVNSIWVTQEVRNKNSNLVYAKPMEKGQIYTDRFDYRFSTGFYLGEVSGVDSWNWSNKQSQLVIDNKANESIVVNLKFLISSKQDKDSNISVYNDEKNKHFITANRGDKEIILAFKLKTGENIIHFISEESSIALPSVTARPLYFYIKNLVMTEVR
jgi:hypothetical protein